MVRYFEGTVLWLVDSRIREEDISAKGEITTIVFLTALSAAHF